ncbi:MAG: DUF1499 domain-containing protein [Gammaproteobacteria bacterium]|nr:DUF1499 domain-containing protein [Gammaproteobacteria bacterium]
MIIWLIISAVVVIVSLVLMQNQANLSQAPGVFPRLKRFLSTHQAELSRNPALPELLSPHINQPAADLFAKLPAIVEALGWQISQTDPEQYRLQAVVTTALFKFKDDVEITVKTEGDGSYLLARSRSRVGRADFAANSKHLQLLAKQLRNADQ